MDVTVSKSIVNGEFVLTVTTGNFSQAEEDLLVKWGIPRIQIGGTFPLTTTVDSVTHDATYTFPEEERQIKKFKLVRRFPAIDSERELLPIQEAQADDYASILDERLQDAITDLKGLPDNFTEDTTNTY